MQLLPSTYMNWLLNKDRRAKECDVLAQLVSAVECLAEGGRLLPSKNTLFAAVVEVPEVYKNIAEAWRAVPPLDLSSGLPLVLNTLHRHHLKPEHLVSEPCAWRILDYASGARVPAQAVLELPITRNTVAHGLGIWFETQLLDESGYSTGLHSGETFYGHIFLPWLEPISLHAGEICSVDLRSHLVGRDYIWQWETNLPGTAERKQVHFRQSTFCGSLFPPSVLQQRAAGFVPVLNEAGLEERWIFQAIDGKRLLEDIAAEAARLLPHVFRRSEDAFKQAAEIAEKFSR